jgi:hypothetical protein
VVLVKIFLVNGVVLGFRVGFGSYIRKNLIVIFDQVKMGYPGFWIF